MLDKLFSITSALLLILLLSSCTKNFQVVAEIPTPLIDPIALTAQLDYSDEFKAYKFVEKSDDRSLESVDFGVAQVSLYDSIFGSLFDISDAGTGGHDLKIEPQILDFQYAEPKETKLKLYEVWIKYRLKVSDSKNEELADWVVKGYGKTPTSMLSSHLKAFNTACNVALRDVGAQLAIGFRNQPSIKAYLTAKLGGNSINTEGPESEVQDSQLVEGVIQPTVASIESLGSSVESAESSIESLEGSVESSPKKTKDSVGSPEGSFDLELVSAVVSTEGEMNQSNEVIDTTDEEFR
jgi:hypothetical protein